MPTENRLGRCHLGRQIDGVGCPGDAGVAKRYGRVVRNGEPRLKERELA